MDSACIVGSVHVTLGVCMHGCVEKDLSAHCGQNKNSCRFNLPYDGWHNRRKSLTQPEKVTDSSLIFIHSLCTWMKTKDSLKVWKYTSKNLKICNTYSKSTRYIVNEPKFADTLLWFIDFLFQDIPNMKTSRHMLEFCWESMGGFHILCSLFPQESSFFDTAIANLRTLSNNYDVIFKAPTFSHGAGGEK